MSTFKSYRKESRCDYGRTIPDGTFLTDEQLKLGATLRIADAVEKIAEPYVKLLAQTVRDQERMKNQDEVINRLVRSNSALRGVIKRMKRGGK